MTLIHGLGVDGRMWGDILPHLSPHFQLFNPDLPGHGAEPRLPDARAGVGALADWLSGRLLSQGVKKTILVGYSMGATVALRVALSRPDLAGGLALVAGDARWGRGLRKLALPIPRLAAFKVVWTARRELRKKLADPAKRALADSMFDRADLGALAGYVRDLLSSDLRGRLGEVGCPVLLVGGDKDRLAVPAAFEELKTGFPGAKAVLIKGEDHHLIIERERELAALLTDFFKDANADK